jgi:hypothetical protein
MALAMNTFFHRVLNKQKVIKLKPPTASDRMS